MTVYAVRAGGLGNQLFQLAAAISSDPAGEGRLLPGSRYDNHLHLEELAPGLATPVSMRERLGLGRVTDEPSWWQWPAHKALGVRRHLLGPRTYRHHLPPPWGAYEPRREWERPPLVLIGFFQHPDWYRASLPRMVEGLLAAAPADLHERLDGPPAVAVRGGDYYSHRWTLRDEYYTRAVGQYPLSGAQVIGDDARRTGEVAALVGALGCRAEVVAGSAIDDFWRIVAAPQVVMANSTFCWWAVQVGDELYRRAGRARTVVAPRDWLGNGLGPELVEPHWCAV